ncbi:hypothetical protein VTK26DRAFT_4622 [Humicola hyalothermophila]
MSSDNGSSNSNNPNDMQRQPRRGSVTFTSLFRANSTSQAPGMALPTPLATANMNDHRRRVSVSTVGLSGTSPTTPSALLRQASLSTNSDSLDENAIEDDEGTRAAPITPFSRRMSLGAAQAMRGPRGSISPGTNDQGFNWSDQLRSRAESTVTGARPSFSFGSSGMSASPPRAAPPQQTAPVSPRHDRARSVSDMPAPPAQPPRPRPQKPDHFQERILKGDFYMD